MMIDTEEKSLKRHVKRSAREVGENYCSFSLVS